MNQMQQSALEAQQRFLHAAKLLGMIALHGHCAMRDTFRDDIESDLAVASTRWREVVCWAQSQEKTDA